MKLQEAETIATGLRAGLITLGYPRVDIVGSVRRQKAEPGDIELLVEPLELGGTANLSAHLASLGLGPGLPNRLGHRAPDGPRYFRKLTGGGIQVDVFAVVPPSRWGIQKVIRTGDADFSHSFVERLHRFGLRSIDGHIVDRKGKEAPCNTEEECFASNRLKWIPPERRNWTDEETVTAVLGP